MNNVAIILTLNESLHLERCILSLIPVFERIYVVDSFSSDNTKEIANKYSVNFIEHNFINHSEQFNWSLNQIDKETNWVLRIDADEYLTEYLRMEILLKLNKLKNSINGVYIPRKIIFQNKLISHGDISSTKVLRLFRYGFGKCDERWMDEHIKVKGETISFLNPLIDHNLKSITWWINKHNKYASKEAYEIIKEEYGLSKTNKDSYFKSYRKRNIYYRMPIFLRAFIYFSYRFIIRLGFLDGLRGFCFHFLQAFWYRLLVDLKYLEVKNKIKSNKTLFKEAIKGCLDIDNI